MPRKWFYKVRIRVNNAVAVLLLALAFCAPVRGAAPDWLRRAASEPTPNDAGNADAVVLLDEQATTVKDNGDTRTSYRMAIRILRPEGREHGLVAAHFDSETRLSGLRGWSITAKSGEYEVHEKDAVETGLSPDALYQDVRRKVLKIPGADVGSVVGWEYEQKRRPQILQDVWAFQEHVPVRRARFTLELPAGWEFDAVWLKYPAQEPQAQTGGRRWTWEVANVPPIPLETLMPSWRSLAGRMGISYYPRKAEVAERAHASWPQVGRWYGRLASDRRNVTPEIRQKVSELVSSKPEAPDEIRALAAFVQRDIRYVAIEIGKGGHQPHSAQEIFTSRYGDCKDKATLLSAMLREAGIDSYYVLINVTRGIVTPDFATGLLFNHAILAIRMPAEVELRPFHSIQKHPRLGALLFFDPTDTSVPFGSLPPHLQANYGLVVTDAGGELVELPLLPPVLNRWLRVAKAELQSDGVLSTQMREILWGGNASVMRDAFIATPLAKRAELIEKRVADWVVPFRLERAGLQNLQNPEDAFILDYRFAAENYAKPMGEMLMLRPSILGAKPRNWAEDKPRKHPVEFPATALHTDQFEIALPAGYEIDELPAPVELKYPFGSYQSKVETEGRTLKYKRIYEVQRLSVPVDQVSDLKELYRQMLRDDQSVVVLKRSGKP